jgi:26S proteasome regulatory subunit N2
MGTARSDVYELLKSNLLLEDAVAGEAAGLAMGLVMLGTGSAQAIDDMVQVRQKSNEKLRCEDLRFSTLKILSMRKSYVA